jgi:hypothetical protein
METNENRVLATFFKCSSNPRSIMESSSERLANLGPGPARVDETLASLGRAIRHLSLVEIMAARYGYGRAARAEGRSPEWRDFYHQLCLCLDDGLRSHRISVSEVRRIAEHFDFEEPGEFKGE